MELVQTVSTLIQLKTNSIDGSIIEHLAIDMPWFVTKQKGEQWWFL